MIDIYTTGNFNTFNAAEFSVDVSSLPRHFECVLRLLPRLSLGYVVIVPIRLSLGYVVIVPMTTIYIFYPYIFIQK